MKRPFVILFIMQFLFMITGCSETNIEQSKNKPELLVGYIVIENNNLNFDEVEIVKKEDNERVLELGLSNNDMPNGYIIINERNERKTFEMADEVKYIFTDVNLDFVKDSKNDRLYITTRKDEFVKHLGDLNKFPLSEQKIPFFIEIQDGKVISITEKFEYTI